MACAAPAWSFRGCTLNKSMEEKTSRRLSLFTVGESPYLTLLKPFLPTLLNQAKSVVESFSAEFFAISSPRRRSKNDVSFFKS